MGKALVTLTFDDGLRSQFERALPVLDQYDLRASFFLVANTDQSHTDGVSHPDWPKTDWRDSDVLLLKKMVETGHEIGAHSLHHRQPFLDDDPKGEAEGSKRWIEDRLQVEVVSYCYPFCHITEPIKSAVIAARYRQARGGASAQFYSAQTPMDRFNVDTRFAEETDDVKTWARPDCWHVVTFHGIGDHRDGWKPVPTHIFVAQISALAQLRDSGAVEVITFKSGVSCLAK